MPTPSFSQAESLPQVTELLASGGWQVLAGGTDLFPARLGRSQQAAWIDITRVPELQGIRAEDGGWWFGATTTWTDVLRADLPPLFDALKQAAREVGGVQIQNTGTLAGNLCNASPAADGTPVWLALDAQVVLHSARGERRLAVADFVLANRRTACASDELVRGLWVPGRSDAARSIFLKLGGRRYLVISITMVALVLEVNSQAGPHHVAAAVGSCSARAMRLPELERRLARLACSELAHTSVEAGDLAPLSPIGDVRATAEYRHDATATLLQRAFRTLAASAPDQPTAP